jgi:hypothetical protein
MSKGLATLFEVAAHNALALSPPPGRKPSSSFLAALLPLKLLLDYIRDPEAYAVERARDERINRIFSDPPLSRRAVRNVRVNPLIFGNFC